MAQLFKTAQEWRQDTALIRPGVFCYELPGITINEVLFYRFKVGGSPPQRYINLPYAPNLAPAASVIAPTSVTGPGTSTSGNIPTWADSTGSVLTPGIPQSTFATAAQGLLADTAVQPGDDLTDLGSGAATAGQVPEADGAGGITWETPSGGSGITQLTGDITAGPGSGSQVATLATVNSNVGPYGSVTQAPAVTVNAKGLVTAVSLNTITPAVGSITGLGTGVGTFLATPSSANLAAAVTDETGTGALVFATSPTLVTPALGTPSALVGTNITGTAAGLTAGNVTTNANLTGPVTSVGNATTVGTAVITDANLVDMAQATFKGRASGAGTGVPGSLSANDASAILDSATDPFIRTSELGLTVQMETYAAGSQTNSTTTLAVANDTEINLSSTGTWTASYNITYTAAATTTGALFTVNTAGVLAVSNISGGCLYTTLTGDADNSLIGAFAGGLPVASSRVATPSLNGAIITVTLVVTTPGPLQLEWRSEVGGSAIVITTVSGFAVKTGY